MQIVIVHIVNQAEVAPNQNALWDMKKVVFLILN